MTPGPDEPGPPSAPAPPPPGPTAGQGPAGEPTAYAEPGHAAFAQGAAPGHAAPSPPCPRCGRQSPAGAGPFCPYCGRYLAALDWVALTPDPALLPESVRARPAATAPARYDGPPRYRQIPRWGLPLGPWRSAGPDDAPTSLQLARALAGQLVPVLWVAAAMSAIAAVAEVWRYVLLLISRSDALSPTAVAWSDSLVWFGGWASLAAVLASGYLIIAWTLQAMRAAAQRSGTVPVRSTRAVVLGWMIPGLNLAVPGAVLTEIEHSALDLPPDDRPRPSRELLVWWALWGACVLLGAVTALWALRDGTQALADGVVLHAWLDVLAVVTAVVTARVVRRLTDLLEPTLGGPRELLVSVAGPARA
ncbi:uncharacterized protein DUF4328 [Pseudonocardia sediminis]|uniref:Uncharacterized protein DUF4328 n=1 Tax=Pseudonocardia sediminis TaxID=1397368 RepID=A0A4Q7UQI9_PSEST|nr:DUF4328 domain-containing protein [Pseudonocardia sediminis]RZT83324.1 uncharacterized protein DUF4328 [Pseudonocardia sediminis]